MVNARARISVLLVRIGGGVVVSGGVLQNLLLITFLNKSEKR